jgi:hypothetical protein
MYDDVATNPYDDVAINRYDDVAKMVLLLSLKEATKDFLIDNFCEVVMIIFFYGVCIIMFLNNNDTNMHRFQR